MPGKEKVGQKRKMYTGEIVDPNLIKGLQNYDKYTILNPLSLSFRSNYLNKKFEQYNNYTYLYLLYVNANLRDSYYPEKVDHLAFSFKAKTPTELLDFSCELLGDKAKPIKFTANEKKFPVFDFIVSILKLIVKTLYKV